QETPLSLLLVDVDDLKSVNDTTGHVGGDRLLVAVGRVAAIVLRRSDRAFRVGGDEFAILLPNSDVDTGLTVARRILASALSGGDPTNHVDPFSLSIGVSPFPDASSLFAAAEKADRTVELDLACLEIVAAGVRLPDTDAYISVNLSPRTLESSLFHPGELKAIFHRNGISLERVVLELTEREQVEDIEQLRKNVEACRRAGMRLAAD